MTLNSIRITFLRILFCLASLLIVSVKAAGAEHRTWTDATGQFRIEAEFVEFKNGKVHLRKKDGTVVPVSPGQLSKGDQQYYRDLLRKQRSSAAATESSSASSAASGNDDWPWWRGPNSNGVASAGPLPPVTWSENENILWKTPVPGRGHASPTVVGNQIFLATADEARQVQSVVALDRESGRELWKQDLHRGGLDPRCHQKNTQASSTVACDGERVFASFMNGDQVWVTALALDGKQIWQTSVGGFKSRFGYSASPTIYKSLVIVAADNWGSGWLAGITRDGGKIQWQQRRPTKPSYASPIVHHLAGRDQLLIAGCDLVASYDPLTGRELWAVQGTTESCVGTVVADSEHVFASGGYPGKETICIRGDGSRQVVWRNRQDIYVPSMLLHDGYLYTVTDNGIAYCWNATTGQEGWRARLGGNFSASPTLAGDNIYVPSEGGVTIVFKANPTRFEQVAENHLGDETFASHVICGGRIYLRVADRSGGSRQEYLYCIGSGV